MAYRNKYFWQALAKKKRTPRLMQAHYAGTCATCKQPFNAGDWIYYLGSTRECWHRACFDNPLETNPDPGPATLAVVETQAEDSGDWLTPDVSLIMSVSQSADSEPENDSQGDSEDAVDWFTPNASLIATVSAPAVLENSTPAVDMDVDTDATPHSQPVSSALRAVHLNTGPVNVSVQTDLFFTYDGNALFLSLLGPDSKVKAITGYFLDSKTTGRNRYRADLSVETGVNRYGRTDYDYILKSPDSDYRLFTTKSGNACHQILADQRFTEDVSIEKDYRFLLLEPGQPPATALYQYLEKRIPSPMLPAWSDALYAAMIENGRLYQPRHSHEQAKAELITARFGDRQALRIRATEESLDALVSYLTQHGRVSF